jgi:hypothetical protein
VLAVRSLKPFLAYGRKRERERERIFSLFVGKRDNIAYLKEKERSI